MRHTFSLYLMMICTLLMIALLVFHPDSRPVSGTEACRVELAKVSYEMDAHGPEIVEYRYTNETYPCQPDRN